MSSLPSNDAFRGSERWNVQISLRIGLKSKLSLLTHLHSISFSAIDVHSYRFVPMDANIVVDVIRLAFSGQPIRLDPFSWCQWFVAALEMISIDLVVLTVHRCICCVVFDLGDECSIYWFVYDFFMCWTKMRKEISFMKNVIRMAIIQSIQMIY